MENAIHATLIFAQNAQVVPIIAPNVHQENTCMSPNVILHAQKLDWELDLTKLQTSATNAMKQQTVLNTIFHANVLNVEKASFIMLILLLLLKSVQHTNPITAEFTLDWKLKIALNVKQVITCIRCSGEDDSICNECEIGYELKDSKCNPIPEECNGTSHCEKDNSHGADYVNYTTLLPS